MALMVSGSSSSSSNLGTDQVPYAQVYAVPTGSLGVSGKQVSAARKYLIASFPDLKQVAYCQLPDNVIRPLVLGSVVSPGAVAVDSANRRLFVADPPVGKVYLYKLTVREDGRLRTNIETDADQQVAIEGFAVSYMTVNARGDLYFTGKAMVSPPQSSYDSVFVQSAAKFAFGNAVTPLEVYSRSNSGNPSPKVWLPSGIAVDAFFTYWANGEAAKSHGSIVKASLNNGALSSLNAAQDSVRGVMCTGTAVYFLTQSGVFGVQKSQPTTVTDPTVGLVAAPPPPQPNIVFDPQHIAFDYASTAYFTDTMGGVIYSLPASDLTLHGLTKFVEAPGVFGIAIADMSSAALLSASRMGFVSILAVLLAIA